MAGMDLSFRREDTGISVFWMIIAAGAASILVIAMSIIWSEAPRIDNAVNSDGVRAEGVADVIDGGLAEDPGTDSLLENGAGVAAAGPLLGSEDGAARTDDAPEQGATDPATTVTDQ